MPTKKKKSSKDNVNSESVSFMAVLVLFAGFSVYSFVSFFNSTNDYIDGMYASVADVTSMEVPPECSTCPPFPVCSPMCGEVSDVASDDNVAPYPVFTDVMSTDPGAKALEELLFAGIVNGYDDGSFKPFNAINRAELLTVLTTAVDADLASDVYANCFSDVKTEWFAPFVCYAKVSGWVSGYEDGSYRPANTVLKAEALKIVLESLGYDVPESVATTPYTDVAAGEWFAPYAVVAADSGILPGFGAFDGGHEMNRLEFVEMLYKAMVYKGLL